MENKEQNNNHLNEFRGITSETAQMYTFWNTLKESAMKSNNAKWATESQEMVELEKKMKAWWEYKVYKLHINGIAPLKWDFMRAKTKIEWTPKLKKLIKSDLDLKSLIPLIIKESGMDNSKVSPTWARWYFQITNIALQDINKTYWLTDLKLDRNNATDNVILWILYRKRNVEIVNTWLKNIGKDGIFPEKDKNELYILSYNIWSGSMLDLLKKSKAKSLNAFKQYMRSLLWCTWPITKKKDSYYKIEYYDLLDWKSSSSFKDKKLAEWLRYLEIIKWLQWYMNKEEIMTSIWTINCDNASLYSQVKALRDKKVFKQDANINAICKIILETNWYKETETPKWVNLILIKEALKNYLN